MISQLHEEPQTAQSISWPTSTLISRSVIYTLFCLTNHLHLHLHPHFPPHLKNLIRQRLPRISTWRHKRLKLYKRSQRLQHPSYLSSVYGINLRTASSRTFHFLALALIPQGSQSKPRQATYTLPRYNPEHHPIFQHSLPQILTTSKAYK